MSKVDDAKSLVQLALDKVMDAQQSRARENVERLRRVHPGDTPQELIRRLDRSYLSRVTVSGGASGVAAIVPGVRIPTVLPGAMAFTEASAFYLLSLAEVHGLHAEDIEQRRSLLATVLLGGGAARGLDKVIEHVGPYYGRRIVHATPMSAINRANKMLRPHFIHQVRDQARGPGAESPGATWYRCRARRRRPPRPRVADDQVRTRVPRTAPAELGQR
ncbi:hypothetical protein ABZT08_05925 [Streptomyces sp. NPDC005526]|uniref:hypothetical protein n=1 Tax=Streptomyces sp. NPDC005526 TaxID=3156885 RepID=UPI0033B2FF71